MRRFVWILLACAIGILGCGCEANHDSVVSSGSEAPTLYCSKYELPFDYSGIYDVKSTGDTLLFYAYQESENLIATEKLVELNIQTGNTLAYPLPPQSERLIAYDKDADGTMWYITASQGETHNVLRLVSADQKTEYDITDTISNAGVDTGELQLLTVNSQVFSILSDQGKVILLDHKGNLLHTIDTKLLTPRQARYETDRILITGIHETELQAVTLNCSDGTCSSAVSFPDFDAAAQISASGTPGYDFVAMEGSMLYGANMDGTVVCLYDGSGELGSNSAPVAFTDGSFFVWSITPGEKTELGITYQSEFFWLTTAPKQFSRKETEEATSVMEENEHAVLPKTVKLALTSINTALSEEVKAFNSLESDVQIEIVDYSEYGDQAERQLQLDIASGDLPDIIECGIINLEAYIGHGMLVDLTPMLQRDYPGGTLNQAVLEATCDPRGQFVITPFYGIKTLVSLQGNPAAEYSGYQDFLSLCADEGSSIHACTGREALRLFLTVGIQNFVNLEERSCNFESEAFLTLLNACKQTTGSIEMLPFMESDLADGTSDLMELEAYGFADIRNLCGVVDPAIVGYPSDGSGTVVVPNAAFALTTGDNIEEAWEFVQYLLEEEIQAKFTYKAFPLRNSSLDKMIAEESNQMSEEYQGLAAQTGLLIHAAVDHVECGSQYDFLQPLILECAEPFFAGDEAAETTAKVIQNKIELYFSEQS